MNIDDLSHVERRRIAIELDVEAFVQLLGPYEISPAAILPALHKARYEMTDVPDVFRHESRNWLEIRGYNRHKGLPWPPFGQLER